MPTLAETLASFSLLGKLLKVEEHVSPSVEAPLLFIEAAKKGDGVVFIEEPEGASMPLVSNIYWAKTEKIYGSYQELVEKTYTAFSTPKRLPRGALDQLSMLTSLASISSYIPEVVEAAPVLSKLSSEYEADLTSLPAVRHLPAEEAPSIVNPVATIYSPAEKRHHIGVYRAVVIDEKTLVLHVPRRSEAYKMLSRALKAKATLEVAITVGADPYTQLAATPPTPPHVDKFFLAGLIGGSRLQIVRTGDHVYAPAGSEIILYGYIEPGDTLPEPRLLFEDGALRSGEPMPVFHLKKIFSKHRPFLYTSALHYRYSDAAALTATASAVALAYAKTIYPAVDSLYVPPEAAGRVMLVDISPAYREEAQEVGLGLLTLGLAPHVEAVIMFSGVDLRDPYAVFNALTCNVDYEKDIVDLSGLPSSELFHGEYTGKRLLIDATPKRERQAPQVEALEKVRALLGRYIY